MKRFPATALLLLLTCVQAMGAERPTVIELFTSQGCSSCPPAETLLGELAQRPDVLALAFHVDYWDYIGWKDRFGLPVSAERQTHYSKLKVSRIVATPQMIVDGKIEILGSDRGRLAGEMQARGEGVPIRLERQADQVSIDVDAAPAAEKSTVLLVSYLPEAETPVARGENAGKSLREFNIVRSLRALGGWQGAAQHFRVERKSLPDDATRLAVLVQQIRDGAIVGATSIALK